MLALTRPRADRGQACGMASGIPHTYATSYPGGKVRYAADRAISTRRLLGQDKPPGCVAAYRNDISHRRYR